MLNPWNINLFLPFIPCIRHDGNHHNFTFLFSRKFLVWLWWSEVFLHWTETLHSEQQHANWRDLTGRLNTVNCCSRCHKRDFCEINRFETDFKVHTFEKCWKQTEECKIHKIRKKLKCFLLTILFTENFAINNETFQRKMRNFYDCQLPFANLYNNLWKSQRLNKIEIVILFCVLTLQCQNISRCVFLCFCSIPCQKSKGGVGT